MTRLSKAAREQLYKQLQAVAKRRTAKADVQFDEDGNPITDLAAKDAPEKDANVLVVEANAAEEATRT